MVLIIVEQSNNNNYIGKCQCKSVSDTHIKTGLLWCIYTIDISMSEQ